MGLQKNNIWLEENVATPHIDSELRKDLLLKLTLLFMSASVRQKTQLLRQELSSKNTKKTNKLFIARWSVSTINYSQVAGR